MKTTLAFVAALSLALPFAASAQSSSTAKPKAKAVAAKKAPAKKKHLARSAVKAVEENTPVADDTGVVLTDADLAVAQRVYTGDIKCELGADVVVAADDKKPGFFNVSSKGTRYRMHPVESRTGAIRLEDPRAGALWLQLGNKSMLMNQKQGVRVADECQAPAQVAFAEEMKKNPPKALFDGADAPKK